MASLALILVLAGFLAGWVLNYQRSERFTEVNSPSKPTPQEQKVPRTPEPVARIPAEDVPGREISGLPRYPGSVRVEYERGEREGLKVVRARYLTRDELDAARAFYRGVFRAHEWHVANVEYSEDRWTFLVVHGGREANVIIEPHGRDVTRVEIEFSEPLPEKGPTPKERPQKWEDNPAPQPATPAPAPQPAPVPGYDDGGDDFGDD